MKTYSVLGLMSGTSLDGLDLAYCRFNRREKGEETDTGLGQDIDLEPGPYQEWTFSIEKSKSISYSPEMRLKLQDSILLPAEEVLAFHNTYGTWLGEQARNFIEEHDLSVEHIASHGHTTHHRPEMGLTFQIGCGQHLANASGIKTICDFRTNDIALSGQGAPLVPIGDLFLFGNYDFCLNLGGISNVSFDYNGDRIAYDIGLANMVLNHITRKNGLDFDKGGQLAATGQVNSSLLEKLNDLEYYRLPYPKSTGYEWFLEKVAPLVDGTDDTLENLLHTGIHHICEQVAVQVNLNAKKSQNTLFVTGGGALNDFLMETLQIKLGKKTQVVVPDRALIEFKEALVFALMGVLRIEGLTNVLSSVTGAKRDSCSGILYHPS